jgi:outer membrane protein TolC
MIMNGHGVESMKENRPKTERANGISRHGAWLILAPLAAFVLSAAARAEEPVAPDEATITVQLNEAPNLEAVLKATLSKNGQIQEAEQDVEIARAQVDRAKAAMWPKGQTTLLLAPLFEERGNALHSVRNYNNWGPYISSYTQIVQPLLTFGQISGYRKAAEHQEVATGELAKMKRNEVLATVKDFYYTCLMAADLEKLVGTLSEFLSGAMKDAEENKNKKNAVKPHDLNRLKIAYDDLQQKGLYAKQGKQTAQKAVLWMTGNTYDSLALNTMEPQEFETKSLQQYLEMARVHRPELKALVAGQIARNSLADAKQAQSYPTLFVGGVLDLNWSPVRDPQQSFYAQDMFNRLQGGVAIGLRLDLEFARHNAEASEERAQSMKLKATESYAAPGIEVEVSRAYWELEQSREGLEIAERRKKTGRKWFIGSAMGWSIGVTPAKDLMEALEGDGTSRQNYIQTIYLYNSALAKLSKAVGTEITTLKY